MPIAVLTTICCFWPTGIIAIFKAVQVWGGGGGGGRVGEGMEAEYGEEGSLGLS